MNLDKLDKILGSEKKYRRDQCYQAIFLDLIDNWNKANNLPQNLKIKLNQEIPLNFLKKEKVSDDGNTHKTIFDFSGDVIESVLMRHADKRHTVCVSSQVGCPMDCAFCATGALGFKRNLSYGEIVAQALHFARILKKEEKRISNIVFMGMGEPLLNYDNVILAIKFFNNPKMFNIGARKISISTAGHIPGIKKLSLEKLQINLAISLHAPNDQIRNTIMPINKKYPIADLLKAVSNYIKKTKRRVMIEYLLLKNINDSAKHAKELSYLLKKRLGGLFFVNLLTYNETGSFKPSPKESHHKFKKILLQAGIETVKRYRFGSNIKAACGQLAGKNNKDRLEF